MDPATESPAPAIEIDSGGDELQRRDAWFTASPDPWREIVRLRHGGDRSFATTVEQWVNNAQPSQWPQLEAKLSVAAKAADLTDAGRQFICRMLALVGSSVAIAAVEPWLHDERTADDARLALDLIPEPAVDAAYRDALSALNGRPLIGLIGSIVRRGDRQAVDALTAIALDEDRPTDVRSAAERAVERLVARQAS